MPTYASLRKDEKTIATHILSPSERAVNWAKACALILPVLGTAVVSVLGWFKSDSAESGVDSLLLQLDKRVAKQERVINTQSEKLETMYRRLVFFQAHQEGFTAGQLYAKNEQLERELTELKAKRLSRSERAKRFLEILREAQKSKAPVRAAPAPPPAAAVQQIPRLKSAPFTK